MRYALALSVTPSVFHTYEISNNCLPVLSSVGQQTEKKIVKILASFYELLPLYLLEHDNQRVPIAATTVSVASLLLARSRVLRLLLLLMLLLPTLMLLLSLLVLQFGFALARDRDVPEGRVSVALLVLVVPTVEVDVEHDDGTGGQTRQEVLLIVRQRQRSDSAIARREGVQRSQVERSPNLDDSFVSGGHQIFSISRKEHAL